jgi:hypothetical protein
MRVVGVLSLLYQLWRTRGELVASDPAVPPAVPLSRSPRNVVVVAV